MNVLDENIPESQRLFLEEKRIHVRQIGVDLARKGTDDQQIIPLLHSLSRPTFFTLDTDYYDRRLRHENYCLVHLVVEDNVVADFVRRFLRHPALRSKAQRMGTVVQIDPLGLAFWRIGEQQETHLEWV